MAEFEELGQERIHGRRIVLGRLGHDWRLPAPPPVWFTLFVAADAAVVDAEVLWAFAEEALLHRCAYVSTWGPGCERLHDVFDDVFLDQHPKADGDPFLMTTWHTDEPLGTALWFGLTQTIPTHSSKSYEDAAASVIVVAADDDRYDAVRELLLDQDEIDRESSEYWGV